MTSKSIFEVEVFFSSQNLDLPFYLRRLLELFFFFLFPFSFFFLFSFFYDLPLEDLGVLMIFEKKITSSKTSFQIACMEWRGHEYGYTGGGCIFWNGVMHANIAKL
jgi:hypothetical protein